MDLDTLLGRAISLADGGDWGPAANVLRDNVADFADEASVHCALGVAERELGNDGVAYECFKKALALQLRIPTCSPPRAMASRGSTTRTRWRR